MDVFLQCCWIRVGALLAGDTDHLTICRCPGSCESLKVLKSLHSCIMSYRDAFDFSRGPRDGRSVGRLVNLAVKNPVVPTKPLHMVTEGEGRQ